MSPLPLGLTAEIVTADGSRYRWGANRPARDVLQNFSFSTKIGEGFSDAEGHLARRIDIDYPDLNLVDSIIVSGMDGSVAYEGRLAAMPREVGDTHSIGLQFAGWMSHTKDRRFSEIYVDRDLGAWGGQSVGRRAANLAGNLTPIDGQQTEDVADATSGILTSIPGPWASPYKPVAEAWYDAGPGLNAAKLAFSWKQETSAVMNPALDANWQWFLFSAVDDKATSFEVTANLAALGPSTGGLYVPVTPRRYFMMSSGYNATPGGAAGATYGIRWNKLAVYGDHGLPLVTGEPGEPDGVLASDVLKDLVNRFCPQLNTDGVQTSTYVIQHLAFKDRTFPYDAMLEVNKYHLWHLGVWENRTLTFRPYDLTDYDWEIRTDDPGTTFSPQGPSTDTLFNGIVVSYTDLLTGKKNVLTPQTNPELGDYSETNPWNQHGVDRWDEIELSTPVLQASAVNLGRAALGDRNRPKTPGTITVQGYVRDRQGNPQPVWKVRAGDTISVTNFPNDTPRLIVETTYDNEQKQVSLSIDRPFALLDAYLDRLGSAVGARGLT